MGSRERKLDGSILKGIYKMFKPVWEIETSESNQSATFRITGVGVDEKSARVSPVYTKLLHALNSHIVYLLQFYIFRT